jgi:MFS family permease
VTTEDDSSDDGDGARSLRRLLGLASAIVFVDVLFYSVLTPLLPTYVDQLDLSKAQAGVLSASYAIGSLLAALPAGLLANRFGPRRIIYAGLLLLSFSSVLVGWVEHVAVLDLGRFLQGVAGALIWQGAMTWLIVVAPDERKGSVIGTAIGAGVAGALLGPAVGGLANVAGTELIFSLTVVVCAGLAFAAAQFDPAHVVAPQSAAEVVAGIRTRPVLEGIAFDAIPGLCFGALAVLVPLRMSALGGGAGVIAAAFVGTALLETLLAPIAGSWSDRVGRQRPYIAGLTICAGALALIAVVQSLPPLIVALLISSVGAGLCVAPAFTLLSDAAEASELDQSYAVALTNTAWSLGQGIGALGGGALATFGGNSLPLIALVGLLAGTAIYARTASSLRPASAT